MTKFRLGIAVLSALVLVLSLLVAGNISASQGKKSMVGLVSFSTDSNTVVGMVISANRGMEKLISYQIPLLTGTPPYTFYAPYALSIKSNENGNESNNMGSRYRNSRGNNGHMRGTDSEGDGDADDDADDSDNTNENDDAEDNDDSDTMMDDEDDNGRLNDRWSNMRWAYDTYITLANTSNDSITINVTFYDNEGNILMETDNMPYTFNLGPYETVQKSVLEILGLR